jgi:excisionase family DNA binding protein
MMASDTFRRWLQTLAEAEATVPARVVPERLPTPTDSPPDHAPPGGKAPDTLLTVGEVAERLGVSNRWVYRNADRLPFTRRLTSGTLRFSERGLERWKETRR